MARAVSRSKFHGDQPLTARPEERIAARTAQRRSAVQRPARLGRPTPMMGAIIVLAIIGLGIAAYTTYVHYHPDALICSGAAHQSSCAHVQFSIYNNVAGIPVSILGLAGYLGILSSLGIRNELGRAAGFGIALIGFLFSLYLTYREAFSLHQYCEWCLGSAACMTLLTVLLGMRFLRTPPAGAPTVAHATAD